VITCGWRIANSSIQPVMSAAEIIGSEHTSDLPTHSRVDVTRGSIARAHHRSLRRLPHISAANASIAMGPLLTGL